MDIKYRLQQYEDGTFGYYLIDGDEHCNYKNESKVVYMQGEDEDRDEFITKNGITFTSNQYGSDLNLDRRANNEIHIVRGMVAEQGYGLDKLINDEHWWVRTSIARKGYNLDILINDEDPHVRAAVARQDYGLDILINDESDHVRSAVASRRYGLNKLINDESHWVREMVARCGYGFNKLINDEDKQTRKVVAEFLNEVNDDDIITLGNKLLDMGYKLSTNSVTNIFADETCTKFREFHTYGVNGLIYQVLARLLWKNIRVKEIYDPKFSEIMKIYLRQHGLLNDDQIGIHL